MIESGKTGWSPVDHLPAQTARWVETMLTAGRQLTDKSECSRNEVGTASVGAPIDEHSSIPCSQESTETDGIPLSGEKNTMVILLYLHI